MTGGVDQTQVVPAALPAPLEAPEQVDLQPLLPTVHLLQLELLLGLHVGVDQVVHDGCHVLLVLAGQNDRLVLGSGPGLARAEDPALVDAQGSLENKTLLLWKVNKIGYSSLPSKIRKNWGVQN